MSVFRFFSALLAALLALPAYAADEDTKIWNAQFIKFNAGKDDKIFVLLESQQRLTGDVTRLGQFILRPYVAYQPSDNLQIGAGYAYFRSESGASPNGFIFEHRAYTEVNYRVLDRPGIKIDTRSRLESRQSENIPDHSIRVRSMVQATMPITKRGLGAVIFAEPFYTGNDTPNFPGGFEQIRNFGGFVMPVNKNAIS
jgi:hypothetical protein